MQDERISRRLDDDQIKKIEALLESLKDNEERLNSFYRSPLLALEGTGVLSGLNKEQQRLLAENALKLITRMINGTVVFDSYSYVLKENVDSYTNRTMDHNWDLSSYSKTEYDIYVESKAGAKSESSRGSSYTETNTFSGVSFIFNKLSEGPLISEKDLLIIKMNLINSINVARL
mgnify:CR=1 FL=1